jgi:hypothetical protein
MPAPVGSTSTALTSLQKRPPDRLNFIGDGFKSRCNLWVDVDEW